MSFPLTLRVEAGGQELYLSGNAYPEDDDGPSWFEIEKAQLVLHIRDYLNPLAMLEILIDITDLLREVGGEEFLAQEANDALLAWQPDEPSYEP